MLISSLTFTIIASGFIARAARYREQTTFEAAVAHTLQAIEGRMQVFTAILQGTAGLFAQAPVSRQEFSDYVRRLHLERDYVGLRGIGYSPIITRDNRQPIVEAAHRDGIGDFELWPANAEPYMAVVYMEPLDAANRSALGFDLTADPVHRAAIMKARDTMAPVLGGPSYTLFVPLFHGEQFAGVVYAPFVVSELISGIFAPEKDPRLAFTILDDGNVVHESLFGYLEAGQARWHAEKKLTLAGHEWQVRFRALPAFLSPIERAVAPSVAIAGVLISLLLFVLARSQTEARQAALESNEARAMALQQEQAARKEAEDTSAVLDSLFRATPAGLAVFDRQRCYVKLNPALAEMNGVALGQHIGRTLEDVNPDFGSPMRAAFESVLSSQEPIISEVSAREHTWLVNLAPVRTGGDIVGVAAVVLDISDRKRAEQELQRSNAELDQFAYVASHDLKAPLRGIAALSEWIEEDVGPHLSAESQKHMHTLRGRVARLEALIDGILRYSRAGRRDETERMDTGKLLDEVVAMLSPSGAPSVRIATPMPTLQAERVPLQQVFLNLVSNAFKYAGDCEVRATDAGSHWEFCVHDSGPGIAPQFHEKVWGIFQTLQPRDKIEGTGIGLAVVRKIVETRGGRTWLESAEGQGASFFFSWPKAP